MTDGLTPRTTCPLCGGPKSKRALRCRDCRHPDVGQRCCADCGCPLFKRQTARCRPCYMALRQRRSADLLRCDGCGAQKSDSNATQCLACRRAADRERTACQDCGGRVAHAPSVRCWPCHRALRRRGGIPPDGPELLAGFDPARFCRLIERADVEWTPELLAERAGVGASTIRQWLRGDRLPSVASWRRVAAVLALAPCVHCAGSGMVDESSPEAVTASVVRQPATATPLHLVAPRPERKAFTLACGLTFDPDRRELADRDRTVPVTAREADVLLAMVSLAGRWAPHEEVAAAAGMTANAANTHRHRLVSKLKAAGLAPDAVLAVRYGAGAMILLAPSGREERVG